MPETKTPTGAQNKTDSKYPKAVYAVAGLGDFVYEQLRRLPEVTGRLQNKAADLRTRTGAQAPQWKRKAAEYSVVASDKAAELGGRVDPARVRDSIVTGTQQAADQATKLYDTLVSRGERAFEPESAEPEATATAAPAAAKPDIAPAPDTAKPKAAPKKAVKRAPRAKAE